MPRILTILCVHLLGGIAGWLAFRGGVPLPWMLGSIAVAAPLTLCFGIKGTTVTIRTAGQLLIGIAMGLYLSPEAVIRIAQAAGPIALAAFLTILLAVGLGLAQARVLKMDMATGIFSCVPGGPIDMANLAAHHGGSPERTALAQTLRMALIVAVFPQILLAVGATLARAGEPVPLSPLQLAALAGIVGLSVLAGRLAKVVRLINPYFVGPLLFAGGLTAVGAELPPMPDWLLAVAQVLLGVSIGSLFSRDLIASGISTTLSVVAATFVLLTSCLGLAWLLHWLFGLDLRVMILAVAPGGAAEMAVSAQAMSLDVPMVVAFQLTRVLAIAILLPAIFAGLRRRFRGG